MNKKIDPVLEKLVKVTRYSDKIKEQSVLSRIEIDHPILIRDTVAKKLAKVANNLPKNIFLKIDSGYRSQDIQKKLWLSRSKKLNNLIQNPDISPSSHITGGAVDVSLLDSNRKEINLSEPFVKYYENPELISKKISKKAQKYRIMLNNFMLNAGFAPKKGEYWHFSFGDQTWADYYHQEVRYKNIRQISKNQSYSFVRKILNRIVKKVWRLLIGVFHLQINY